MKKYHFGYYEFIKNYKSIEIYLDDDVDPESIASSLICVDELITWKETGVVTNETEFTFFELHSEIGE